ncbi:MAG: VOC family protein [Acidobacteria bacterium]|nr:VOC family protein [Acidobacteriota bacterium]
MQKITTYLWFNDNAEEAVNFYVSLFNDSKIISVVRHREVGPGPAGQAFFITFELAGQQFYALNGGPMFKFTEAISLYVNCQTQEEIDTLWKKLTAEGEESRCGWLKDKYGLSWQIIPTSLGEMMQDADPARAGRVMQALLQMNKLDIAKLQEAYNG